MAASKIKNGGTVMFAMFALAGDVGCSVGPTLVGLASSAMSDNLKMGILFGVVFPVFMLGGLLLFRLGKKA